MHTLQLLEGDITAQDVDVIVNAANSTLLGGGGVDGAIHRVAGPRLLEACRVLRATELPEGLPVGEAVATPGFDLAARHVVHTVGPIYGRGTVRELAAAYRHCFAVACSLGAGSIALPAVSAGVYGWPLEEVASTALGEAVSSGVEDVRFVLMPPKVWRAFDRAARKLFGEPDDQGLWTFE